MNFEKRKSKQHSNFYDDCGVSDSASGTSPKQFFVKSAEGALETVFFMSGLYGKYSYVNKKENLYHSVLSKMKIKLL